MEAEVNRYCTRRCPAPGTDNETAIGELMNEASADMVRHQGVKVVSCSGAPRVRCVASHVECHCSFRNGYAQNASI
jgi:hypothetical protein